MSVAVRNFMTTLSKKQSFDTENWFGNNNTNINISGILNATEGGGANGEAESSGGGGGASTFYLPWNNPENIISKETSDDIVFVLECIIFPIITFFGVTGNILSLIVLFQPKMRRSTTTIILIALALSDALFLTSNLLRKSTCMIKRFDKYLSSYYYAKSFGALFYLKTAFSRVSSFMVVLISVERFIAVAFPMKVRYIVTKTRITVAVLAIWVCTLGLIAVIPFWYTDGVIKGQHRVVTTSHYNKNPVFFKIFAEYILTIFFRYVPAAIVLVLNVSIVALLKRNPKWQERDRSKIDNKAKEQRKITFMLLVVALIFLICFIPGDAFLIVSDLNKKFVYFGTYHNLFMVLSDICLLFEMLNSSVNFIIYMALNKNFSITYLVLYRKCTSRLRTRRPTHMTGTVTKLTFDTKVSSSETGKNVDEAENGEDVTSGFEDVTNKSQSDHSPPSFSNAAFQQDGEE